MKDTIDFREIFDQKDAHELNEIIVRMATRMLHFGGDRLHVMLANPLAIQMLSGYMAGMLITVCNESGIDLTQAPAVDGQGFDTHLEFITRN